MIKSAFGRRDRRSWRRWFICLYDARGAPAPPRYRLSAPVCCAGPRCRSGS